MKKKQKIKACIKCGSLNLTMPSFSHGFIPFSQEITGFYVCKDCNFRSMPIEFDSMKEYKKFLEQKRKAKKKAKPEKH